MDSDKNLIENLFNTIRKEYPEFCRRFGSHPLFLTRKNALQIVVMYGRENRYQDMETLYKTLNKNEYDYIRDMLSYRSRFYEEELDPIFYDIEDYCVESIDPHIASLYEEMERIFEEENYEMNCQKMLREQTDLKITYVEPVQRFFKAQDSSDNFKGKEDEHNLSKIDKLYCEAREALSKMSIADKDDRKELLIQIENKVEETLRLAKEVSDVPEEDDCLLGPYIPDDNSSRLELVRYRQGVDHRENKIYGKNGIIEEQLQKKDLAIPDAEFLGIRSFDCDTRDGYRKEKIRIKSQNLINFIVNTRLPPQYLMRSLNYDITKYLNLFYGNCRKVELDRFGFDYDKSLVFLETNRSNEFKVLIDNINYCSIIFVTNKCYKNLVRIKILNCTNFNHNHGSLRILDLRKRVKYKTDNKENVIFMKSSRDTLRNIVLKYDCRYNCDLLLLFQIEDIYRPNERGKD